MVKAAINGFGRIGRTSLRVFLNRPDLHDQIDIVAINTSGSMDVAGWAHVLKYDTAYRQFNHEMTVEVIADPKKVDVANPLIGYLHVASRSIAVLAQRDPEKIPWGKYGVDVVIESTGVFRDLKGAGLHLKAGAKRVLISAPSKGEGINTHVLGVNAYDPAAGAIADNASCTTNCISPITQIILDTFGIKKAALTTVHAFTDDQNLHDGSHEDLRRARSAPHNIVPTSTGAATATTQTIPKLKGLFDGLAIRIPVITGSISDLTYIVGKATSVEEVNRVIKDACNTDRWRGLVAWTEEPLVSSDIIGRPESAIVDLSLTQVIDGDLVKILAWYDNEWGYCNRLIEQAAAVGKA